MKKETVVTQKVCYACEYFKGYYSKGLSKFERTKVGFCRQHEQIVNNIETCDLWKNNYRKLYASKKTSIRALTDLLNTFMGIKQILEESYGEDIEIDDKM